jgi:hypothetical protein
VQSTTVPVGSTVMPSTMVEDDYRLGRGILDDFRPTNYKSYLGLTTLPGASVVTPGLAVSTPGLAVTTTPALATTSVVPGSVAVGPSHINDFL